MSTDNKATEQTLSEFHLGIKKANEPEVKMHEAVRDSLIKLHNRDVERDRDQMREEIAKETAAAEEMIRSKYAKKSPAIRSETSLYKSMSGFLKDVFKNTPE